MSIANQVSNARPDTANREPGIGYRLLYFFGLTPWDHEDLAPEFVELIEGPKALPPGRALDLGCGTGTHAIYLAKNGWDVTGLDYVSRALNVARQRAAKANVAPTWIQGDVTRLTDFVGGYNTVPYNLLLDFGCFHGLRPEQCRAYAAGIRAVTAPGATFLLFSFSPGRRGPAPRGVSSEEIASYFGNEWEILWAHPADGQHLPPFLKKADPTLYRLQRR